MPASDLAFIRSDTADVVRMPGDKVAVKIDKRLPHLACVFLVYAKDNRFGEAIRLFQEVGKVTGDGMGARPECHHTFKILGLVFIIRDRAAIAVNLVTAGAPSSGVPPGDDAVDTIGREEAILDSFSQAIFVNRIAEVE